GGWVSHVLIGSNSCPRRIKKMAQLVQSDDCNQYTVIAGLIWFISFHIAKIVPNLPAMVMKKKEQ
ncbi:hypothetical protein ACFRCQ_27980, partial [Cytobacillus firmus]|uniref:hypothetical protein n=1 Tax=Cytobacillus firmus TaxID=1399 RepID=UPI0036942AE0